MNYHHFTIEERCCLREYYIKGKSYREIARLLGRNVSSVSRELRRNRTITLTPHRKRATYETVIVIAECFGVKRF